MAAVEESFTLFKGRYNALKFTVEGVSDLDAEGWEARWTFSENPGASGAAVLIDKSDNDDISFSNDKVYVDIFPGDMSGIGLGNDFYHELTLIDDNGNPRVAAYGDKCIVRDTTDIS